MQAPLVGDARACTFDVTAGAITWPLITVCAAACWVRTNNDLNRDGALWCGGRIIVKTNLVPGASTRKINDSGLRRIFFKCHLTPHLTQTAAFPANEVWRTYDEIILTGRLRNCLISVVRRVRQRHRFVESSESLCSQQCTLSRFIYKNAIFEQCGSVSCRNSALLERYDRSCDSWFGRNEQRMLSFVAA